MADAEILKVEFYDYTMTKLTPTNLIIETIDQQYEINEEITDVAWGADTIRRLHANVKIEGNVMNAINTSTSSNELTSKRQISFIRLYTIDKEYTKFKLIQ